MNHSIEPSITENRKENTSQNAVYIGITLIVGVVSMVATALIAIFSPENLPVVPWIAGGLSAMGVALGYFSSSQRG